MYCIKCGFKIPDGSKFCPVCGTSVDLKLRVSNDNDIDSKQTQIHSLENQSIKASHLSSNNMDGHSSPNPSTSESISILESISNSFIESESISRSESVSLSESISQSESASLSESISILESVSDSISIFLSQSTSKSTLKSIFDSQSKSVSLSESISRSESVSSSESISQSKSVSLSESISTSKSEKSVTDNMSTKSFLENSDNDSSNSNNDSVLDENMKEKNDKYNSKVKIDSESKELSKNNENITSLTKDEDVLFCSYCGTRLSKEEEVCPKCGANLRTGMKSNNSINIDKMKNFFFQIANNIRDFISTNVKPKISNLSKKDRRNIFIALGIVLCLLVSYLIVGPFPAKLKIDKECYVAIGEDINIGYTIKPKKC